MNATFSTTKESLNSILFDVEKVENPAIAQGYNTLSTEQFAVIGQTGENEETILNYCSDRYSLVKNSEIYPELEKLLSMHPKTKDFNRHVTNRNNVNFMVRYTFPTLETKINKNDSIMAGFDVWNSYDGKRNFGGSIFEYRLICSNGMMGMAQLLKISNRHTEVVKEAVERMFIEAVSAIEAFEMQSAKYELLAQNKQQAQWEERLTTIAEKSGIVKFHEEAKAIVRAEAKELYNGEVNDFLIYNALNNVTFDDTLNKKAYEVRVKTDEKVFNNLMAFINTPTKQLIEN